MFGDAGWSWYNSRSSHSLVWFRMGVVKTFFRRPTFFSMLTFLLNILFDLATGSSQKGLDAAEALEQTARNPKAQRYRTLAVVFFLLTSAFLLAAAIAFTLAPNNILNEILGWTGIASLHVCVFCGLRYAVLNRDTESPVA